MQKSEVLFSVKGNLSHKEYLNDTYKRILPAPTQSILQKWIRDVKGIAVDVYTELSEAGFVYNCDMIALFDLKEETSSINLAARFKTYEAALEAGLIEALKLIKL